MVRTTINQGHRHFWRTTRKYTSRNAGHKHKIDIRRMLALTSGTDMHTHKLLRT